MDKLERFAVDYLENFVLGFLVAILSPRGVVGNIYKVVKCWVDMRWSCFVVVGFVLMSLGLVAGGAETEFTVEGCSFDGGLTLAPGTCSQDGTKYCSNSLVGYDTITDVKGCSLGASIYTFGDRQCCPQGFVCDLDEEYPLTCARNPDTEPCVEKSENDCAVDGCFWMGAEGCVSSPREYSCSSYMNPEECGTDAFNLGREGVGSEICGDYFVEGGGGYVISVSSCECVWDGACKFKYSVIPDIYVAGDYRSFNCSKDFVVGDCVGTSRAVSWTAVDSRNDAFLALGDDDEADIVAAAECLGGSEERVCGQPIVKLPGFSLFALISSLGFLAMFYFFRENKK